MSLLPGNNQYLHRAERDVRAVRPDDIAAMAKLHTGAFVNGWNIAAIESLMKSPGVFGLVAPLESGSIAGFILGRMAAQEGEILTIVVDPVYRARGVGTYLLEGAIENFTNNATEAVFLEVADGNESAVKLYTRQGFTKISTRPSYSQVSQGNRSDALLMCLTIG